MTIRRSRKAVICFTIISYLFISLGATLVQSFAATLSVSDPKAVIGTGENHTAVVMADGKVKTFGANVYGQLGNNTTTDSATPVSVYGIDGLTLDTTAVAVSAGGSHTVMLMKNGTVKAFGYNAYGQLGNGTLSNSKIPVKVSGIDGLTDATTAEEVHAGYEHTVVLMKNGTVKVFGRNTYGQFGNGTTNNSSTPITMQGIDGMSLGTTAASVSGGYYHTVILMKNGTVKTTGYNAYGQLGNGTIINSSVLVTVSGIDGISSASSAKSIATGAHHTIVLMQDGTVKTMGLNGDGQLGNGTTTNSMIPVNVSTVDGLTNASYAVAVDAGYYHNAIVMKSGIVKTFGRNLYGQLGNGTTTSNKTPIQVIGIDGTTEASNAIGVSTGAYFSIILMKNGCLKTVGDNYYGQLANGTVTNSVIPVTVSGIDGLSLNSFATATSAGFVHSTLLLKNGTIKTFGYNANGQLGNGKTTNSVTPVSVSGIDGLTDATTSTALSSGYHHTATLLKNGTVRTFGYNNYGQLGNGKTTSSATPVSVLGIDGLTPATASAAVASGYFHTVVLLKNGTVKTFGYNNYGQLGNGTTTNSAMPVSVTGIDGLTDATTAIGIAAGYYHTAIVMKNGTVKTFGYNNYGQLGNGKTTNSSIPVSVSGIDGVTLANAAAGVSSGLYHTMVLMKNGTVKTFGYNAHGQLGNNTTTNSSIPVTVIGIDGLADSTFATAIASGYYHSMALMKNGTVKTFGYNGYGQLGNGSKANTKIPVTVSGINGVTDDSYAVGVSSGLHHSLFLMKNGTVKTVGYNFYGQLGNGISAIFMEPKDSLLNGTEGNKAFVPPSKEIQTSITVDGYVHEWNFIAPIYTGNTFVKSVYSAKSTDKLYFMIEGYQNTASDIHRLFIDSDAIFNTGFRASRWTSAGMDYKIENNKLFKYSGTGTNDVWQEVGVVEFKYTNDCLELSVNISLLNPYYWGGYKFGYEKVSQEFVPSSGDLIQSMTTVTQSIPTSKYVYRVQGYPFRKVRLRLNASNSSAIYKVYFDPSILELVDACGETFSKNLTLGIVPGTNVNIRNIGVGYLEYSFANTGDQYNSVVFQAKVAKAGLVTYEITQ